MTDLLLILFTVALLVFSHLLRTLLAMRLPTGVKFSPLALNQAPDIMADLFDQTDRALIELGFQPGHWVTVRAQPVLPGVIPPLMRLYHHRTDPIVARVSPPFNVFSTDRCQVVFLSISAEKVYLATANRQPELFPRPPEAVSIILNTRVDSLAEQFHAHKDALSKRGLSWLDRSTQMGDLAWSLRLVNRYEKKSIQWIVEQGYVKRLADASVAPRLPVVLRFLGRFLSGREQNPPPEHSAIPTGRAAYLFQSWQQSQQLPPPAAAQLGLFLVSALAFVMLAGVFWDWTIALLLLVVISFHEAGHWLAMRLLGYRNLQILMLPLVGGVTLGQETESQASRRILVSLMGPLPGIILGFILLALFGMDGSWLSELGMIMLIVNYLNLLPIMPLDGGQILKALIPIRRFGWLIALEWLGAAVLLLLGWLVDSLFLAALGLLPLFSGLALIKRKQIFDSLSGIGAGGGDPSPTEQVASVIQAIDQADKKYRPLVKKAQEIRDILGVLRLKPATPAVAGALLSLYFALFLLPPVAVFATSPDLRTVVEILFSDYTAAQQEAYERAIELPVSQVINELAEATDRLAEDYYPESQRPALGSPASRNAIVAGERRLGVPIEGDYRQVLEVGNGFLNLWGNPARTHYLILPVEQVRRFGQITPEIESRIRTRSQSEDPLWISVYAQPFGDEVDYQRYQLGQLEDMLLIGNRFETEYLLLQTTAQSDDSPAVLLIHESVDGLNGTHYESLHHYLADLLSRIEMAGL